MHCAAMIFNYAVPQLWINNRVLDHLLLASYVACVTDWIRKSYRTMQLLAFEHLPSGCCVRHIHRSDPRPDPAHIITHPVKSTCRIQFLVAEVAVGLNIVCRVIINVHVVDKFSWWNSAASKVYSKATVTVGRNCVLFRSRHRIR